MANPYVVVIYNSFAEPLKYRLRYISRKQMAKHPNYNYICRQCIIIMNKRKLDVAISSSHPKLQKLTAFGFSPNSSDKTITEPNDKPCSPAASTCSTSSGTPHYDERGNKSRKLQDCWKLWCPWLIYDPKLKQMFCGVCIKAKFCIIKNIFFFSKYTCERILKLGVNLCLYIRSRA